MNANIREIRGIRGQSRFRRVTTSCQTTKKLKDSSTKTGGESCGRDPEAPVRLVYGRPVGSLATDASRPDTSHFVTWWCLAFCAAAPLAGHFVCLVGNPVVLRLVVKSVVSSEAKELRHFAE
jgi:hypothetical protein